MSLEGDLHCQQSDNCIGQGGSVRGDVLGQCSKNVSCSGIGGSCRCGAADTCSCLSDSSNSVYVKTGGSIDEPSCYSCRCTFKTAADGGSSCIDTGAIVGIVLGAIFVCAIALYLCYRNRKHVFALCYSKTSQCATMPMPMPYHLSEYQLSYGPGSTFDEEPSAVARQVVQPGSLFEESGISGPDASTSAISVGEVGEDDGIELSGTSTSSRNARTSSRSASSSSSGASQSISTVVVVKTASVYSSSSSSSQSPS